MQLGHQCIKFKKYFLPLLLWENNFRVSPMKKTKSMLFFSLKRKLKQSGPKIK